jgi:hypothetical protein
MNIPKEVEKQRMEIMELEIIFIASVHGGRH